MRDDGVLSGNPFRSVFAEKMNILFMTMSLLSVIPTAGGMTFVWLDAGKYILVDEPLLKYWCILLVLGAFGCVTGYHHLAFRLGGKRFVSRDGLWLMVLLVNIAYLATLCGLFALALPEGASLVNHMVANLVDTVTGLHHIRDPKEFAVIVPMILALVWLPFAILFAASVLAVEFWNAWRCHVSQSPNQPKSNE